MTADKKIVVMWIEGEDPKTYLYGNGLNSEFANEEEKKDCALTLTVASWRIVPPPKPAVRIEIFDLSDPNGAWTARLLTPLPLEGDG